jgi:hypothetical protein
LAKPQSSAAKDYEATLASAEAWQFIANVKLLSRQLARA